MLGGMWLTWPTDLGASQGLLWDYCLRRCAWGVMVHQGEGHAIIAGVILE